MGDLSKRASELRAMLFDLERNGKDLDSAFARSVKDLLYDIEQARLDEYPAGAERFTCPTCSEEHQGKYGFEADVRAVIDAHGRLLRAHATPRVECGNCGHRFQHAEIEKVIGDGPWNDRVERDESALIQSIAEMLVDSDGLVAGMVAGIREAQPNLSGAALSDGLLLVANDLVSPEKAVPFVESYLRDQTNTALIVGYRRVFSEPDLLERFRVRLLETARRLRDEGDSST